jgi:N-acetylmuramoyl-L-alanine amidase
VVVIDPGHNGANSTHLATINAPVDAGFGQTKPCNTTGTETNDGYPEHKFTWAVAQVLKQNLEAAGVTVIMTRASDDGVGPCVDKRAAVGNDNHADAVISIHGDGSASGDHGFYAMTSERAPNGAQMAGRSVALASAVRDALVAQQVATSNYVGSHGLWKRDDLAGLNLSLVPTTMVELGNMRNAGDAAFMKSKAGQQAIAAGLAAGILKFLGR